MNGLKEALKTGLRTIVLATLPVIMASFNTQTGEFHMDYKLVIFTAVLAGLKFIDSWLHESGVAEKGLTRF